MAGGISYHDDMENSDVLSATKSFVGSEDFTHVAYALSDGVAYVDNGEALDIGGRDYFKAGLAGKSTIECVDDCLCGDGTHFVIAVPIMKHGAPAGVVAGCYPEELFGSLLIPEMYGGEARSLVCRTDGEIIISPYGSEYSFTDNNIFASAGSTRLLMGEKASLESVRADIEAGGSGAFAFTHEGVRNYCVYVPLDIHLSSGEPAIMLSIVPASVISSAANSQTLTNIMLFAIILLSAILSFAYFVWRSSKDARIIAAERDIIRLREEQYHAAADTANSRIARYDIKSDAYRDESAMLTDLGFKPAFTGLPQTFIDGGSVAPESVGDIISYYEKLRRGETPSATTLCLKTPDGSFRWFRAETTLRFDYDGEPSHAIISYRDVTEQREKEALYVRWQNSMSERDPDTYTMFRCNLSRGASFDVVYGNLLKYTFRAESNTFNARTREYASQKVWLDDFNSYSDLLNAELLLASYYRGEYKKTLEYRELTGDDTFRWLRVTTETVKYPDSDDIEIILLYENIDEKKTNELAAKEKLEYDPMTGVLNRAAFVKRFEQLICHTKTNEKHAVILLDVDGFKLVNDAFGHTAGDRTLREIAESLRSTVRGDDFLGRLGGDEFLLCLKDVPNETVVEKKALQIQSLMRRAFSLEVQISVSMGIAFYPNDGVSFDTLYQSIDKALRCAKTSGKDSFAFFSRLSSGGSAAPSRTPSAQSAPQPLKRRMLVIDDNEEETLWLREQFSPDYDFIAETDREKAMARLYRFGFSVSVILLSLNLRSTDSFKLLEIIRKNTVLSTIPVIAICGEGERAMGLQSLRYGAADFILRPLDGALVSIRVQSAISKADNDRLRAQNSVLQMQGGSGDKYRTVFEKTGTVVIEYDWINGQFSYDPAISEHIAGSYDDRSLWHVFLSDMVADAMNVKTMQTLVHDLASDRRKTHAGMDVMLKTPSKAKHWFSMNIFKRVNEYDLTSKMIITFLDINDNVLADNKLRFQAEHDMLTGILNRTTFLKKAEDAVKKAPEGFYTLLVGDIDSFKSVNERFGREEGDKLLLFVAERLHVLAEMRCGICGRLGNDTFALILPTSKTLPDKALKCMQDFFSDYPLKSKLTSSCGAFLIDDILMPMDIMIDRAMLAKDLAKKNYSSSIAIYDSAMGEAAAAERDISERMEAALAAGQFDVYLQPQFNHATGRIVVAEALVRWFDPQKGVVFPGVFIPIFEKNGFITKLDEYVWECTAVHFAKWLSGGHEAVPISVNVSRADLHDPELCTKLSAIVKRHRIPVELFRLEVTESLFSEDAEEMISVINDLHKLGFLIEMDDFGSGYSSLNILKDVPVDIIKLDMKFFAGRDSLGRGGMIIVSVLRMARWLNIPVIAEGVETKEQADFLLSIGCPTIQGYYYARPMPVADFEEKLSENMAGRSPLEEAPQMLINTSSFWDPKSLDSLLFNEFIGPALAFEFHDGRYDLLRTNRQLMNLITLDGSPLSSGSSDGLCGLDSPKFRQAVLDAVNTGSPVKVDFDGSGGAANVTATLRLMSQSQGHSLIFATVEVQ